MRYRDLFVYLSEHDDIMDSQNIGKLQSGYSRSSNQLRKKVSLEESTKETNASDCREIIMAINGIVIKVLKKNERKEEKDKEMDEKNARRITR